MHYPPIPQIKSCNCEDPCISTDDVYYAGPNLPYSGIQTNTLLTEAIERLDNNNTSGTSGSSGTSGTSGVDGTSGVNGTSGVSGTSGTNGTSGTSGTSGSSGTSATAGTSGTSGIQGDKYATTSSTNFTLGNAGTITVGIALAYTPSQTVIISYNSTNYQESVVISYDNLTGSLQFSAPVITVGSGTYTSWNINLAGASGGDGSSGSSGSSGTSGINGTSGSSGSSSTSGTSGLSYDYNRLVTETTSGYTLTNIDSGGIIIFKTTAAQTLTIPIGLINGFECTFVTLSGVTLTVVSTGNTLNNAASTIMLPGLSFTLKRMLATDTYIVTGNL